MKISELAFLKHPLFYQLLPFLKFELAPPPFFYFSPPPPPPPRFRKTSNTQIAFIFLTKFPATPITRIYIWHLYSPFLCALLTIFMQL